MSTGQELVGTDANLTRNEQTWGTHWPRIKPVFYFLLFETAFYFAYQCARSFSPSSASPFWFPDSVLLSALLVTHPRRWWIFVLGSLPIRLFSAGIEDHLWFLLPNYAIDSLKGVVAALILRRLLPNPTRFESLQQFAVFCLVAALLIPAAAAFGGAALRIPNGYDYWFAWVRYFLGDVLTQLVITPAILSLCINGLESVRELSRARRIEAGLLIAALIATGYFAVEAGNPSAFLSEPRFYAPILLMAAAAIRFGMLGASAGVAVLAFLASAAAIQGRLPFSGSPTDVALGLQSFLISRTLVLYLIGLSIEQMNRAQNLLRESEGRFRTVADSAPVLIWTSGRDKLCDFVNKGWLEFTGRTMEQNLGNGWAASIHPDDAQHCLDIYQRAFDAREPCEIEYRLRRHDGEYRWILDKGVPRYSPNGDFVGYIGSAIDIAERKRVEELNTTLASLQRMAQMGELSAGIAHEVRQPLHAILLNAHAAKNLLDKPSPPLNELKEIVSEVHESILRANDVISRTQALFRKHELSLEPVDINGIVYDALILVAREAVKHLVEFRLQLAPDLPPVLGDRIQLHQVVLNLIANGMHAMSETALPRQLTLQTRKVDANTVEAVVLDRGCGIAPDNLTRIFEPFFSTKTEGTGLGLSIARSIITAHGGRIWAENTADGGAAFHVVLRIAEAKAA